MKPSTEFCYKYVLANKNILEASFKSAFLLHLHKNKLRNISQTSELQQILNSDFALDNSETVLFELFSEMSPTTRSSAISYIINLIDSKNPELTLLCEDISINLLRDCKHNIDITTVGGHSYKESNPLIVATAKNNNKIFDELLKVDHDWHKVQKKTRQDQKAQPYYHASWKNLLIAVAANMR